MKNNTKGIGFKNFRRFENFPLLEFGNITYMVGRNNSGKSTMVKALLLIMDYLQNQLGDTFSFDNNVLEDANIVTFGRAKCNFIDEPEIIFSFKLNNYEITCHISGEENETKVKVNKLLIIDTKDGYVFNIDHNKNQAKIIKKSSTKIENISVDEEIQGLELELDELKTQQKLTKNKGSKEALNLASEINKIKKQLNNLIDFYSEIKVEEREADAEYDLEYPLDYDINHKELVNSYEEYKEEAGLELDDPGILTPKELLRDTEELQNFLNVRDNGNSLQLIVSTFLNYNSSSLKLLRTKKETTIDVSETNNSLSDMVELEISEDDLKSWINNFTNTVESINITYLGANPSKQSALFPLRAKDNALAQAIHQFYQLKIIKGEKQHQFVKHWMNEFEVGKDFNIKFYAGEAYEFHVLDNDGNKNHLSDKGMGSLQAMVLILKVASLIKINKKEKKALTLLVEEPELNLHPALQSKLTDFFHEVNKEYGFNFIVETHSEYMIRKTQLIALEQDYIKNQDINPNPFKIVYFHKEEGPYEMEFTEQGKFNKDFGPGFYDEAGSLTLKMIKELRKNQAQ
jgi:predicted ATPase